MFDGASERYSGGEGPSENFPWRGEFRRLRSKCIVPDLKEIPLPNKERDDDLNTLRLEL